MWSSPRETSLPRVFPGFRFRIKRTRKRLSLISTSRLLLRLSLRKAKRGKGDGLASLWSEEARVDGKTRGSETDGGTQGNVDATHGSAVVGGTHASEVAGATHVNEDGEETPENAVGPEVTHGKDAGTAKGAAHHLTAVIAAISAGGVIAESTGVVNHRNSNLEKFTAARSSKFSTSVFSSKSRT